MESELTLIGTVAAGPWNIGWQEVVLILLIIGIFTVPGIVVLGIIFFIMRRRRANRAVPPSVPAQYQREEPR